MTGEGREQREPDGPSRKGRSGGAADVGVVGAGGELQASRPRRARTLDYARQRPEHYVRGVDSD
eukprot:5176366-Pyramimonas_sp.AAC.1